MFSFKNIFKKEQKFLTEKKELEKKEGGLGGIKKKLWKAGPMKIFKDRKQSLKFFLLRAGLEVNPQRLITLLFDAALLVNLLLSAYLIYVFSVSLGIAWMDVITSMLILWILVFPVIIFVIWTILYVAIDLRIYKRRIDVENVLPDFLQLTASNINAGMTIDRALWFAVRPRFGVLAKEIEMIAKETMGGVDLRVALNNFAQRYDSITLKSSISMLNEGIDAGGEISDLLNRIALNLQEQKTMMNEISASVTSYVIFITFAAIVAAPFLFAMSGILIQVIRTLGSSFGGTSNAALSTGLPLAFTGTGVSESDFRTFSIVSLMLTALFSAMMVSTIKKGDIKSGVKYIPIYIAVSMVLYFISKGIASKMLVFIYPT